MAAVIGRGSFGDLVAKLQAALAKLGYYAGVLDGDYGGGTERAVQNFQADKKLKKTGAADEKTWTLATGLPWPNLFDRCLQVTARFEGHGYTTLAGNFDGAGLTWGIIGFTLKHGEIQAIVREVEGKAPAILTESFGAQLPELLQRMRAPINTELFQWCDSISLGQNKYAVQEPWRSNFAAFGKHEIVRDIQRQRARTKYFEPSLITMKRVQTKNELASELGIALCFDIHVQN